MDSRSSSSHASESIFVQGQSATELLERMRREDPHNTKLSVVTFCRAVDALLDGGIPLGELTEIAGPPGIGKSQMAMQLAITVQTPAFAGLEGSCIYIDTEGSLTPERCLEMATSFYRHVVDCHNKRLASRPHSGRLPNWFTPEGLLEGIQVMRVHDVATLDATISSLETLCQGAQRPVKMVIVDSLAFPVRAESTNDFIGRTQQLTQWAMKLSQLAQSSPRKAVVVLNQMTTTTNTDATVNKENSLVIGTSLTPALGEAWAHAVTNRVVLAEGPADSRIFRLVKSPRLPSGQAEYGVFECGIRDVGWPSPRKRPRYSS